MLPLVALGALVTPALEGILSNAVPENEQGLLQGVNSGFAAIATIISPLLMTYVFYTFTDGDAVTYFPGAAYLLAALFTVISAFAFWRGVRQGGVTDAGRGSGTTSLDYS